MRWGRAAIGAVALQHALGAVHAGAEFERHSQRVGRAQRAALLRHISELASQAVRAEEVRRAIQVFFLKHAKAEPAHDRRLVAAQHDGMMTALLQAAQVEHVARLGGNDEAERVHPEGAAAAQIADAVFDMAHAHHVERRVFFPPPDRHRRSLPSVAFRALPAPLEAANPW